MQPPILSAIVSKLYRKKLVYESAADSLGIVEYQVINKSSIKIVWID